MVSVTKFARIARLATLPETRGVLLRNAAAYRRLPGLANRAAHDRAQLLREIVSPAGARAFARTAVQHPATRELANAGLMFLPGRYMPLGWAATWAGRRLIRRMGVRP
jgi:hypothetical protein